MSSLRGIGRSTYVGSILLAAAVLVLLVLSFPTRGSIGLVTIAWGLFATVGISFLQAKRLVDIGRPWWHLVFMLVPIYNAYLGALLSLRKGTAPSRGRNGRLAILAAGLLFLFVSGRVAASHLQLAGLLPGAREFTAEYLGTESATSRRGIATEHAVFVDIETDARFTDLAGNLDTSALEIGAFVPARESTLAFLSDVSTVEAASRDTSRLVVDAILVLLEVALIAFALRGLARGEEGGGPGWNEPETRDLEDLYPLGGSHAPGY